MIVSRLASFALLIAIAAVVLLSRPLHAQSASQLQEENARLKAHVAQLETKVAQLEARIAQLTNQNQVLTESRMQAEAEKKELAVLAGVATPDEVTSHLNARISESYDAASDTTTVETAWVPLRVTHGSRAEHSLKLVMSYKGKTPTPAPSTITAMIHGDASGRIYEKVSDVRFNIGSKAINIPVVDYEAELRTRGSSRARTRIDNETLTLSFPTDAARMLAASQSADVEISYVKLTLTRDETALFRALLQRIDDAGQR